MSKEIWYALMHALTVQLALRMRGVILCTFVRNGCSLGLSMREVFWYAPMCAHAGYFLIRMREIRVDNRMHACACRFGMSTRI